MDTPEKPAPKFPLTLASLLDSSLEFSPQIFRQLIFVLGAGAVLSVTQSFLNLDLRMQTATGTDVVFVYSMQFVIWMLLAFLGYYALIATILISSEKWLGNSEATLSSIGSRMSVYLAVKAFLIYLWIVFVSVFLFLLFSIPVIILAFFLSPLFSFLMIFSALPSILYFLATFLAVEIIIIKQCTMREALAESKRIMRQGKWYQTASPIFRVGVIMTFLLALGIVPHLLASGVNFYLLSGSASKVLAAFVLFVSTLAGFFVQLYSTVCRVGLYLDSRARFEASDLLSSLEKLQSSETALLRGDKPRAE